MESPVTFTRTISPVCLPPISLADQYANRDAVTIGWGVPIESNWHLKTFLNSNLITCVLNFRWDPTKCLATSDYWNHFQFGMPKYLQRCSSQWNSRPHALCGVSRDRHLQCKNFFKYKLKEKWQYISRWMNITNNREIVEVHCLSNQLQVIVGSRLALLVGESVCSIFSIIIWAFSDIYFSPFNHAGCADPEFPGVYTRISSFVGWINKHAVGRPS